MTGDAVPLATGDVGRLERLHDRADSVVVTCPDRSGPCPYAHGPDRPDDVALSSWLSFPFCSACGRSLVFVPEDGYDGPEHAFRRLGAAVDGESVVLLP